MPQMKPLNWLLLFMLFSLILMIKITLNYYNMNYMLNLKKSINYSSPMITTWKW